jgi:hypothetical protein
MKGTDNAANFLSSSSAASSPTTPRPALARTYYDPKLPERVHDFTLRHFKDPNLANKLESDLIRFRSTDNIPGIQSVQRKLEQLYFKKYPVGDGAPAADDPFKALLETEAPSRFQFPGGNQKIPTTTWDALTNKWRAASRTSSTNGRRSIAC